MRHLYLQARPNSLVDLWNYLDKHQQLNVKRCRDPLAARYIPPVAYRHYLELIAEKQFDDIPGSDLASVIVSHKRAEPGVYCDRVTQSSLFGDIRVQNVEGPIKYELHPDSSWRITQGQWWNLSH